MNPSVKECAEVQIRVPWGHVSAKWWGSRKIRPVIGLHGWQDNAGTFDTLAPLLPEPISLLAVDLPGHGTSSRLPDGIMYNSIDYVNVIGFIMKEYHWEKIAILGHSTGSIIGFLFTSLFPEKVELFIGLDALKPHIRPIRSIPKTISKRFAKFLIADERNRMNEEPPSYTYDDCIEKLYLGAFYSIDKDKCKYLLDRSIAKSSKDSNKYYFTRDSRLKCYNYGTFSQDVCLEMAKRITVPYLFVKASNGPFFEDQKYFHETIEILMKNPNFHLVHVEGTHHVHLNHPDKVSGAIIEFINKYRCSEHSPNAKL